MFVDQAELWLGATNTYLVAAERGAPALLIDAPPDIAGIEALLRKSASPLVALLLTHGHIDHYGAARTLVDRFQIAAYLHPDDEYLAADPAYQIRSLLGAVPPGVAEQFAPPDRFETLVDGQRIDLGGLGLEVSHTPGHTMGHVCFISSEDGLLFSGDHLFAGSIGRTDLGGDMPTLLRSMREKTLTLADETTVFPGHGPATTIGRERRTNPFLQDLL